MSDSPSFAASVIGASPAASSASRSAQQPAFDRRLALADQREREVCERSKVPARPDRAAGRHARNDAGSESSDEELDGLGAGPREPLGESVRTKEHRRANHVVRVRVADTARMASQQPQLKLSRLLGRDRFRDEAAKARVDAVGVIPHLRFEKGAGGGDALPTSLAERRRPPFDGDLPDLGDREVVARQLDSGRHAASLVRCRHGDGRSRRRSAKRRPSIVPSPTQSAAAPPNGGARLPEVTLSRQHAQVCVARAPTS